MRWVTMRDALFAGPEGSAGRAYVERFANALPALQHTVEGFGLPVETEADSRRRSTYIEGLRRGLAARGAVFRNDGKSIVHGALSPACERCRTGVRSVSEFISLACKRSCWFCFNSNQCDWDRYKNDRKDWETELSALRAQEGGLDFVALTGGEPMLFRSEALDFFRKARKADPNAHLRLYTSGDGLDAAGIAELADAGLDEIRFSVKLDDAPDAQERTWRLIKECTGTIPAVMVEMPVIPGTEKQMRELLARLDAAGAFGINLLELCFPLHNARAYRERGLEVAWPPYRVPYDYGYAGALPVAGSEELALELMTWAIDEGLSLGLHYCSLENKNTAQLYEQNAGGALDIPGYRFSQRTFFYETVRAFGPDARACAKALDAAGFPYTLDEAAGMAAFSPDGLRSLGAAAAECALYLASAVIERNQEGKRVFRDVGLQAIGPADFDRILGAGDDAPEASAPASADAGGNAGSAAARDGAKGRAS